MGEFTSLLTTDQLELLVRLGLAALLGGIIGLERELSGKPAGFRTNLLICVGAAVLTDLSLHIGASVPPGKVADPGRIAAQIVSGIGFLGAGTIIQARGGVHGLTTAATIWVVAAIGMTAGAGLYVEAVSTTALVLLALVVLGWVETRFLPSQERLLHVTADDDTDTLALVEAVLDEGGLQVAGVDVERTDDALILTFEATGRPRNWSRIVSRVGELEGVRKVRRG